MDDLLLKRGENFTEINAELDLKADILMKEVENIMKFQFNIDDEAVLVNEDPRTSDEPIASDNAENVSSKSKPNNEGSLIGATWRGANPEPELRFLRAKLKILTSELERQQSEHHNKLSDWKTREIELRNIREEKDKATQQVAIMSQQLTKLSSALTERSERVQRIDADNAKLNNELNAAKKEAKTATQRANTLELRLNRLIEEGETLKAALSNCRLQEKEEREEQRRKLERQAVCVQRAERQRNELALAFRRQMLLCHNLQQQKELLVAGAALNVAESQFDLLLAPKQNK